MFIKLQADQVFIFWDLIKHGLIQAYKIPREYQQDFSINYLEKLLTGHTQAWLAYEEKDGEKKVIGILCTQILDEKNYGVRTLLIDTIYGFRLIPKDIIDEGMTALESYAKANNCNVMAAEFSNKRVGEILVDIGFETHRIISRKVLTI